MINLRGWDPLGTLHQVEGLYTVQLGCTQGLYERFPIQKYTTATQAALYRQGRSILLYGLTARQKLGVQKPRGMGG